MAMILEFPKRTRSCDSNVGSALTSRMASTDANDWAERASGEIVLFTGVQYRRWDEQDDELRDADSDTFAD